MAGGYRKASDLPEVVPVFPLDGALLLPGGVLPLQIFEPRYLNMVDDAMSGHRLIGMVQTGEGGAPHTPCLMSVGCAGRITSYSETGDGKYLIALTGVCRFAILAELETSTPYRQVRADFRRYEMDLAADEASLEFERAPFLALLRRYLDNHSLGVEWEVVNAAPAPALVNSLSMALPFSTVEKQALLEAPDLEARRHALTALLEIDGAGGMDDDVAPSIQ
ncbi:MAG TPA: LON peptidase substrate-binding domain-containing protein [Caulobacteraceae bacterium]|jgi:Lon protease-like protein|nr:LON peptidase substrate-binding domain-containing protein [Caulobacteraceae bacterium]